MSAYRRESCSPFRDEVQNKQRKCVTHHGQVRAALLPNNKQLSGVGSVDLRLSSVQLEVFMR